MSYAWHVTFLRFPDAKLHGMKHCYARHDAKLKKVKLRIIDISILDTEVDAMHFYDA